MAGREWLRRTRGRLGREKLRRAFWPPAALATLAAIALAYGLRALDARLHFDIGLFALNDLASARGLLSTIATVTVSVAGLSFSVTLVALQLASSQLSPRVLTTFREDRLVQATLAGFLAVFAYALVLLARLTSADERVPELSLLVAILGVLAAFALFVAFVARIVASLQASTVIRRISEDGRRALDTAHPSRIGHDPPDEQRARAEVERRRAEHRRVELRAREGGFVLEVDGDRLLKAAGRLDALLVQRAQVGDLVVTGQLVADAFLPAGAPDEARALLERCFRYGAERTMAADVAFPVRALVDVALRALSPALNDPTTAENALGSVVDLLVRQIRHAPTSVLRVDAERVPRLVACVPDLDALVRLGFEQVRPTVAHEHPRLAARLVAWLEELDRVAARAGAPRGQLHRERERLEDAVARAREESPLSSPS